MATTEKTTTRKRATTTKPRASKSAAAAKPSAGRGKLVIVESPAKARTIGKYLGSGYTVKASMGHVRDLPKSTLGVDVDDDFEPKYLVPRDKAKLIKELKASVQGAREIYLATDPDREGEAIAWHLMQATGRQTKPVQRVVFHEITPEAVRRRWPPARHRHGPRQCAAGAARPRPAGRLQGQPAAVEEGRSGACRPGGCRLPPSAWSSTASERSRPSSRRNTGSLDADLAKQTGGEPEEAGHRCAAALSSVSGQKRACQRRATQAIVGGLDGASYRVPPTRPGRKRSGGRRRRSRPARCSRKHRAGSGFAVRRTMQSPSSSTRASIWGRRHAGVDHLHAYRLDQYCRVGAAGRARRHQSAITATNTCRSDRRSTRASPRARRKPTKRSARRRRTHDPGQCQAFLSHAAIQALPADLAALHGLANAPGHSRSDGRGCRSRTRSCHLCRRDGTVRLPRNRLRGQVPGLHGGVPGWPG